MGCTKGVKERLGPHQENFWEFSTPYFTNQITFTADRVGGTVSTQSRISNTGRFSHIYQGYYVTVHLAIRTPLWWPSHQLRRVVGVWSLVCDPGKRKEISRAHCFGWIWLFCRDSPRRNCCTVLYRALVESILSHKLQ